MSWPFFMTHVYIKGDDSSAALPQDYFTGIPMVMSMKGLWEAVVLKCDVQCSVHVLSDWIRTRESIKRLISVENRAVFTRNFELPRGNKVSVTNKRRQSVEEWCQAGLSLCRCDCHFNKNQALQKKTQ